MVERGEKYKEFPNNEKRTSLLMKTTQTLTATADWEKDKNFLLLRLRRDVRVAHDGVRKTNEFMIKKITGFSSKCNWAWFQFQVFISRRLSHFCLLLFDIFCDYITSLYMTTSLCWFYLLLCLGSLDNTERWVQECGWIIKVWGKF